MTGADPTSWQVYFAAERTLLAWVRTAIAIIGLGFVVARFALFMKMFRMTMEMPSTSQAPPPHHTFTPTVLGVGLVIIGSIATATATAQYLRFVCSLPPEKRPTKHFHHFAPAVSSTLAFVGITLAVYLALTG